MVVRAVVDVDARLEQADPARTIGAGLELHPERVARLRVGELLLACERDLHRPAARARQRRGEGLVLGHLRLRAEPSADRDFAANHLLAPEPEHVRKLVHHEVRRLCRGPELEALPLRVPARDADVLLHHRVRDARIPVGAARRQRALAPAELHVSPRALVVQRHVGLAVLSIVQTRCAGRERLVERERRRQTPVLHIDRGERAIGLLLRVGRDGRDLFADVAHHVLGERRAVGLVAAAVDVAHALGEVGGGDDGTHARHRFRSRGIKMRDLGMRMR